MNSLFKLLGGTLACGLWLQMSCLAADNAILTKISYSSTPPPSSTADGDSTSPIWSQDSQHLLFQSLAANVVTNGVRSMYPGIYLYDLASRKITLVTVSSNGVDAPNGQSRYPAVSAAGQFVAFESDASNLIAGDTNGLTAVFVRDVVKNTTLKVSQGLAKRAFNPSISADGRFVAFEYQVPAVVELPPTSAIYLRDLATSQLTLLSTKSGTNTPAQSNCILPVISDDGRLVVFQSASTDLVPNAAPSNSLSELFIYDRVAGTNRWLSSQASDFRNVITNQTGVSFQCYNPVISAVGKFAAYKLVSSVTWRSLIIRVDLTAGTSSVVASNAIGSTRDKTDAFGPLISADGRYVVYASSMDAQPILSQLFRWDSVKNETLLVTTNSLSGPATVAFDLGGMSTNGELVSYTRAVNDLTNYPNGAPSQAFVRDMVSGETRPVISPTLSGTNSGDTLNAQVSPDGRTVAFQSQSSNLVAGDLNHAFDIFISAINPSSTNSAISLRDPLATQPPLVSWAYSNPYVRLSWNAVSGWTYSVQSKDQLDASLWNDLSSTVIYGSPNASIIDSIIPPQPRRFYRIRGTPAQ